MLLSVALRAAALAALAALTSGCPPCFVGPWGDGRSPAEVSIVARALDGTPVPITEDGASVDLTFPVQGGQVLFIGAMVKNVAACRTELKAKLVHPTSGEIAAEEKRVVSFAVAAGNGYGQSDVSDTAEVANIPACPNFLDRAIADTPWRLELTVTDREGHSATASHTVTPVCRQSSPQEKAQCQCECRANYSFGSCP